MIFVQTLLPKVLGFIAAILLLRYVQAGDLLISLHWPHDMPVLIQVIIMILIADFFVTGFIMPAITIHTYGNTMPYIIYPKGCIG